METFILHIVKVERDMNNLWFISKKELHPLHCSFSVMSVSWIGNEARGRPSYIATVTHNLCYFLKITWKCRRQWNLLKEHRSFSPWKQRAKKNKNKNHEKGVVYSSLLSFIFPTGADFRIRVTYCVVYLHFPLAGWQSCSSEKTLFPPTTSVDLE